VPIYYSISEIGWIRKKIGLRRGCTYRSWKCQGLEERDAMLESAEMVGSPSLQGDDTSSCGGQMTISSSRDMGLG